MNEANFKSGTVWTSDNLAILRGLNSECVDLIYLDPPFNSNRNYSAPVGSRAAGASFKDAWTLDDVDVHEHGELADRNPAAYQAIEAAKVTYGKGMMAYLIFMAVRLQEMHRILKPSGAIYLHCDTTASHYLKLLMDSIFGIGNFRNEVIWGYRTGGASKRTFAKKHDVILFYSKTNNYTFNPQKEKAYTKAKGRKPGTINYGGGKATFYEDDVGVYNLVNMRDIWEIPYVSSTSPERTGYPTQKPLALLERIINASTAKGDIVLDPFCGCATALVAAYYLKREWAGIDISPKAVELVNHRIEHGNRPAWGMQQSLFKGAIVRTDTPLRTDLGRLPSYRSHKHRLYGEQEGICRGCDLHFPFKVMEVDHILPKLQGGTDHKENLQLLCNACNRSKGGKTMAKWKASQPPTSKD